MREALGSVKLMYWFILFFITFVILLGVGFSYARAFRVKNRVVDIIAEYEDFTTAKPHVEAFLNSNSYANGYVNKNLSPCPNSKSDGRITGSLLNFDNSAYNNGSICVYEYKYSHGDYSSIYYEVRMPFTMSMPILGRNSSVPLFYINGETKIIYVRKGR